MLRVSPCKHCAVLCRMRVLLTITEHDSCLHLRVQQRPLARVCTLDAVLACTQVHAPLSKVFEVWRERGNYAEWFDLIGQVCSLLVLRRQDSYGHHLLHSKSPFGTAEAVVGH